MIFFFFCIGGIVFRLAGISSALILLQQAWFCGKIEPGDSTPGENAGSPRRGKCKYSARGRKTGIPVQLLERRLEEKSKLVDSFQAQPGDRKTKFD